MSLILLSGGIGDQGTFPPFGLGQPVFPTDANHAATPTEYQGQFLYVTPAGALTAGRLLSLPLVQGSTKDIYNGCPVAILVGGTTGATVTIPPNTFQRVACYDGSNFVADGEGGMLVTSASFAAHPTLLQATAQILLVNSGGGAFTQPLQTNPVVGDRVRLVDTLGAGGVSGIATSNVTVTHAKPIQNPRTGAIPGGSGSYAWGSNESGGANWEIMYVNDPTNGLYWKGLGG